MILKGLGTNGELLVMASVQRMDNTTWSAALQPDQIGWVRQAASVNVLNSGVLTGFQLLDGLTVVVWCRTATLVGVGIVGNVHLVAGTPFRMAAMPILKRCILHEFLSMFDVCPPTQRQQQQKYRAPMASRTAECPCGGGTRYDQCGYHDDWLTVL